jgi:nucleoside phosphorylase
MGIRSKRWFSGTLLSGSEFVGCYERKLNLSKIDKDVLAVDMESVALAQIAKRFNKSWAVVKTIADGMDDQGIVSIDYLTFLNHASKNSSFVIEKILHELNRPA